jgi:hypothetical protein
LGCEEWRSKKGGFPSKPPLEVHNPAQGFEAQLKRKKKKKNIYKGGRVSTQPDPAHTKYDHTSQIFF